MGSGYIGTVFNVSSSGYRESLALRLLLVSSGLSDGLFTSPLPSSSGFFDLSVGSGAATFRITVVRRQWTPTLWRTTTSYAGFQTALSLREVVGSSGSEGTPYVLVLRVGHSLPVLSPDAGSLIEGVPEFLRALKVYERRTGCALPT